MASLDIKPAAVAALRVFRGFGQDRDGNWYDRRAEVMRRARMAGLTNEEIGEALQMSREGVARIIKRHLGICPACGREYDDWRAP